MTPTIEEAPQQGCARMHVSESTSELLPQELIFDHTFVTLKRLPDLPCVYVSVIPFLPFVYYMGQVPLACH